MHDRQNGDVLLMGSRWKKRSKNGVLKAAKFDIVNVKLHNAHCLSFDQNCGGPFRNKTFMWYVQNFRRFLHINSIAFGKAPPRETRVSQLG